MSEFDNVINLNDKRKPANVADDSNALCVEDDAVLCTITIHADRRVSSWVSDKIETGEQWAWLYGQLAAATHQIVSIQESVKPPSEENDK